MAFDPNFESKEKKVGPLTGNPLPAKDSDDIAQEMLDAVHKPHEDAKANDLRNHNHSMAQADNHTIASLSSGQQRTSSGASMEAQSLQAIEIKKKDEKSRDRALKRQLKELNEQIAEAKAKLRQTPDGEVDWDYYDKKHGINVARREDETDESYELRQQRERRKKFLNPDGSIKDEYKDSDYAQYLALLEKKNPLLKYSEPEFEEFLKANDEAQKKLNQASDEVKNAKGEEVQAKQENVKNITDEKINSRDDIKFDVTEEKDQNAEKYASTAKDIGEQKISQEEAGKNLLNDSSAGFSGMSSPFAEDILPTDEPITQASIKNPFTGAAENIPTEKAVELDEESELGLKNATQKPTGLA